MPSPEPPRGLPTVRCCPAELALVQDEHRQGALQTLKRRRPVIMPPVHEGDHEEATGKVWRLSGPASLQTRFAEGLQTSTPWISGTDRCGAPLLRAARRRLGDTFPQAHIRLKRPWFTSHVKPMRSPGGKVLISSERSTTATPS